MDINNWSSHIRKLAMQRNIFLLFALLLSFAVMLLTILQFSRNERIVIVPTTGPAFWVENSKVSSSYLESMGVFLSDMLLNRSPADAEWKNKSILEHVHPSFYHEIRKQLLQDKDTILKDGQSFVFRVETSAANPSDYTFALEGEFLVFVGKKGSKPVCAQIDRRRYTLGFQCQNYKLLLMSLKKEEI
jgi:type IV conjugative transfer system protein TraE